MIEPHISPRVGRRLLVAAGMAGVLLGLLVLATMVARNGDGAAVAPPPVTTRSVVPDTSVPDPPQVGVASVLADRNDPFRQIVTVPKPSSATAGPFGSPPAPAAVPPIPTPVSLPPSTPPVPASAPTTPVSIPPSAPPVPTSAPTASASPAASTAVAPAPTVAAPAAEKHAIVELKAIFQDGAGIDRAYLVVDGMSYTPAEGELFSYGLRIDIDGTCVDVSRGTALLRLCLAAVSP